MFRAQVCAILGTALMFASAQAKARELIVSVDSRIGGDSNVFRRSANALSDGLWEFSPRALVRDTRETLEYKFSYRPTYQAYFTRAGISGFDHYGRGDLTWRPNSADRFTAGGSVVSSRIIRLFEDDMPTDPDQSILIESDSDRTIRSRANVGYSTSFNRKHSGRVDFTFDDVNFQDDQNVDSRSFAVSVGTNYLLDERTQIGLSLTGRRREGRGSSSQVETTTKTGDITLSLVRSVTPTISLSARAGPSFTKTSQTAPPALSFLVGSDSQVSYVADVSVTKQYPHSTYSIKYSRFESGSAGSSAASTVDTVGLSGNYRIGREWTFYLNLDWTQREQISSIGSSSSSRFRRYSVSSYGKYRLSRAFSVIGQVSYQRFDNRDQNVSSSAITNVAAGSLTLRYSFDPIQF